MSSDILRDRHSRGDRAAFIAEGKRMHEEHTMHKGDFNECFMPGERLAIAGLNGMTNCRGKRLPYSFPLKPLFCHPAGRESHAADEAVAKGLIKQGHRAIREMVDQEPVELFT